MQKKGLKTKDMVIAIFCTLLAILCIVFYFMPAFNIQHSTSPVGQFDKVSYSGYELTRAALSSTKVIGYNWDGLMYIKDTYGFAIILAGVLMPLSILCSIATAVFAYLSWFKGEKFKKFCFLTSLMGMIFQTITLICTWFLAIMTNDGRSYGYFNSNVKGGMSYGSFVSLILVFVIAIVACAYNYFLDDGSYDDEDDDDEYYDDDEELDDDEEYEEVVIVRRKKKKTTTNTEDKGSVEKESAKPKTSVVKKSNSK